jgi:uncharacterized membrane protein YgcG
MTVLALVFVWGGAYNTGVSDVASDLSQYIKADKQELAKDAVSAFKYMNEFYVACFAAFSYIIFLSWLANHMRSKPDDN